MGKIKFVYVIISKEGDYYLEQAMLSMHSLKKYNPGAQITLLTDKDTETSLTGNRGNILKYVDELIVREVPETFTPKERSRFLKTSLRPSVKGDFLYLDNDTIITGDLSGLEKEEIVMGGVYNAHDSSSHVKSKMVLDYQKITNSILESDMPYFNGGVLFSREGEKSDLFFKRWHNIWCEERERFGVTRDQFSLFKANSYEGSSLFQPLNPIFNCQVTSPGGLDFFIEALVLHYWAESEKTSFYPFKEVALMREIKENGITSDTEWKIDNVKKLYLRSCLVLRDYDLEVYNAPLSIMAHWLAGRFPAMNRAMRYIIRKVKK